MTHPPIPPTEHKDILGRDLAVGDYIAYPAMKGDSCNMKLGRITALATVDATKNYPDIPGSNGRGWLSVDYQAGTLRIRGVTRSWRNDYAWERNPRIIALSYPDRVAKLDPSEVPDELKELMK